jgi:hypothetical protein
MNGREGSGRMLVCSSDAASIIEQASQLRRLAGQALIEGRGTPTGARFRFRASPAVEAKIRRFVRWEANCCPFLDFSVDADADEVRIDVKAPSEAEAVLDLLVAVTEAPRS